MRRKPQKTKSGAPNQAQTECHTPKKFGIPRSAGKLVPENEGKAKKKILAKKKIT